ncbi:prolipoprotein diacylglyceryl transferase [Corynebacterium sp. 153RC1]|nr:MULTISPECIES: prolipoprotein diacylglyceryl transferase [unclassified Corynebacterium]MCQ9351669.1 prolipoprotein diacylglyceryl transferase [Corynebacterium sp. 209RC1]MCQ9354038.1 prolipoprotein diacylglyceryl transferase [Corynebacterium sp. 1222RC1]MCQ9355952.1 prolipoprotein diacylglyceryl transferase [Corynebacterium sp. 122RC1]MCQ9358196.1 prolipoprotein diacylglyceryl transferase [Corynebacterium sp. 142RC1]MCQ9360200.1 prolipoprotein diacylglyceryl transferase [Corynebacterium sp. 
MLGPVPVRAYALWIILGIVAAIWIGKKRYEARGGNGEVVYDAAIVAVISGIIGGRLYHVITDYQLYFGPGQNPMDVFKITNGGLGIWGAVALGTLCVWLYLRKKGIPFAPFADALAPGIILAQGIGRLGNYFNQELYGATTDVPWALEIYYRVNEAGQYAPLTGVSNGQVMDTVHPMFLYELLWNVLIFALLLWADRRFQLGHGRVFALYVAGYTFGRMILENFRISESMMIFGLRVNTVVAALSCLIALAIFAKLPKGRDCEKNR